MARAFQRAGRLGMYDAIRWLSLRRTDLTPVLDRLDIPTLLVTAQDDPMWTVPAARAAAADLSHGTMAILPGAGHVGPLLYRDTRSGRPDHRVLARTGHHHHPTTSHARRYHQLARGVTNRIDCAYRNPLPPDTADRGAAN